MPSLRQGEFEKAARSYKAKTGVGCDGLSPSTPSRIVKGSSRRHGEVPRKAVALLEMAAASLHDDFS